MTIRRPDHRVTLAQPEIQRYGSVELCLSPMFPFGEVIAVPPQIRLEVVDHVQKADGLIILGQVDRDTLPRDARNHRLPPRPTTLCVLFTHYVRLDCTDDIDMDATRVQLETPCERIRSDCERVFRRLIATRSAAAGLAFHPILRYL